jgi:hypothetical protein
MKRSDAIKQIVKKSYDARYKALQEAAKDQKFQAPSAVPAAPAAASASARSSSGASSSGGNSTRADVPVLTLRIPKADLKKDMIVLIRPSKLKEDKWQDDVIGVIANSKESADAAIAADPTLAEEKQEALERVPDSDIIYEYDPFDDGYEKEEVIYKEPIIENEDLMDVVVIDKNGDKEQVVPCKEGDAKCKEQFEAYDAYRVEVDDPNAADFELLKENNEEVMADGTIVSK